MTNNPIQRLKETQAQIDELVNAATAAGIEFDSEDPIYLDLKTTRNELVRIINDANPEESTEQATQEQAPEQPEDESWSEAQRLNQEAAAQAASDAASKRYAPIQVPFVNQGYTYFDRQNDLELMQTLLSHRLASVRAELEAVKQINATRSYPDIAFPTSLDKE
jgi:hypothetical protein